MNTTNTVLFSGTWTFRSIPSQFTEILKRIGYGRLRRNWLKTQRVLMKNSFEHDGNVLVVKITAGGGLYKKTRLFYLNGQPRKFIDDHENRVIETACWVDQDAVMPSMEIVTQYPDLGFTVTNLRKLIDPNHCYCTMILESSKEKIVANMD